jgi:hypothetical protein
MAYSYLFPFLFLIMPKERKDDILYVLIIGIMYLTFWLCIMYWLNQINGKKNIEWLLEILEPKLNTWLMLTTHYDIL